MIFNDINTHKIMSKADSLEDGYEYCNCHPETCTHFGGKMWVGVKHKNNEVENLTLTLNKH